MYLSSLFIDYIVHDLLLHLLGSTFQLMFKFLNFVLNGEFYSGLLNIKQGIK